MKSIFISYGNLFSLMKPIEALTYKRIAPLVVLQPVRFILNTFTLLVMIGLIWLPDYGIVNRQINLTNLALGIIAAGLCSIFLKNESKEELRLLIIFLISGLLSCIMCIIHFYKRYDSRQPPVIALSFNWHNKEGME